MQHPTSILSKCIRQIRPALIAVGALSFFMNLLIFVSPIFTMQIYDRVLTSRNGTTLLMLAMIALFLLASYGMIEHYRSRILVQAGIRFDSLLTGYTFECSLARALQVRGVHHAQSMRDVETIRDFLSGGLTLVLMDVPWTPIFLIICFLLHPLIGLIVLTGAAAILTLAALNEYTTREPLISAAVSNLQAIDRLTSSLRNAEAIRGLGMGNAVRAAWSTMHADALRSSVLAGERGGTLLAISKFLRMALQIGVMGVGAYLAIREEISGGVLFAASLLMGRTLAPLEAVVSQWRPLVTARTSYARLNSLLSSFPAPTPTMRLPKLQGEISIEHLTVFAPGTKKPLIAGVTLKVGRGEIVGLIGESGCGKSSLARALVGAWPAAQGCVRIDGNDLRHFDPNDLAQSLGYLPQDVELFPGTIRDNIARFRNDATDEQVVEAALRASAHTMIQRFPNGYSTYIGEDGAGLSGGQRQRIGLARSLFGRPVFVVLDEPNSNLDSQGDIALAEAIATLRSQGTTAMVVTHRPNLLAVVDRIAVMHAGQIKHVGSRDELLSLMRGGARVEALRRSSLERASRARREMSRSYVPGPHHQLRANMQ